MNRSYGIFAEFYDELTKNVEYEKRADHLNELIIKHGGKQKGVLLDLACGTGSLSFELEKLGYDIIAIDNSIEMLNVAMNKKFENDSSIQFIKQDMREIELYSDVDVTVCALDSLNHLESLSDVKKVFDAVYKYTAPEGLFIFDMNTEYKHTKILADNTFVFDTDDVYCVWQNSCKNSIVSIYLDFFVPNEDGTFERYSEDFTEKAYPIDSIKSELNKTGFEILNIYDGDSFEEIKPDSQRIIFIVCKPK